MATYVIFVAIALTVLLGSAAYTFDGGRWHGTPSVFSPQPTPPHLRAA